MNQSCIRINREFNENPLKKTHESCFMVINCAIVNFMAMVRGHQFSMNYRTVFYTTIPVSKFMGHEIPMKSLQTSEIPSRAK